MTQDTHTIEPEDLERTHAEGRRRWSDNGRSGRDEDVDDDHQLPVLRPSCLFADADTDRFFFLVVCVGLMLFSSSEDSFFISTQKMFSRPSSENQPIVGVSIA